MKSPLGWVFKSRFMGKHLLFGIIKDSTTKTYRAQKVNTNTGIATEIIILLFAVAGYIYLKVH